MLRELESAASSVQRDSARGPVLIALSQWELDTFFPAEKAERLKSLLPDTQWVDPSILDSNAWLKLLETVRPRVLVSCWRTPRLPAVTEHLRYLAHVTGSVRGVLPRELLERGVMVTNWGTFAAPYVAEHALLLVLASLRSIRGWDGALSIAKFPSETAYLQTRSLHGARVAIHGFGLIARELVKLLKPFHVEISAYSFGVPEQLMLDHGVRPVESLEKLAEFAPIFVSCEALTDRTRKSIDHQVLSRLAVGSVFVNVGRGAVVDEAALVEVGKNRQLRVASDVFAEEPLRENSPLHELPGAIYSPHIAGPALDQYPRCGELLLQNLQRYLAGQPLEQQVTLEIFDRST
jgi:phosphoglycerate dehydrogenase-like enzyme